MWTEKWSLNLQKHIANAAILSRLLFWMLQKKWKTEQIQECLKMGPDWKGYRGADYDKNFIFTQSNGSQMHICSPAGEYNRIIRLYNQYIAKTPAEQLPNVSPHGLRHSVAALLISENVDARTVAGILGHANPTTTLNIYSYFFKSKGNQAAKNY